MVTFRRSRSGEVVDAEWHQFRIDARQEHFSITEFGEVDRVKYDLETAGITGRDNPDTFRYNPVFDILGIDGRLATELPRHE